MGEGVTERLREGVNECELDYNYVPYCIWASLEKSLGWGFGFVLIFLRSRRVNFLFGLCGETFAGNLISVFERRVRRLHNVCGFRK